MKSIVYLVGDATKPRTEGNKIIAHICNDVGAWGKGFVLALSKLSPAPERAFREWYLGREHNSFALGAVQFVSVSPDVLIANMIGQHGIRAFRGVPPIRYEAVEIALQSVGKRLSPKTHRFICRESAAVWRAASGAESNRSSNNKSAGPTCWFLSMICSKTSRLN